MDNEKYDNNIMIELRDQENEYKAWLEYARMDYESAEYLNKAPMHPKPMNIICYHCQQAAEKSAKALVVYYGSRGGLANKHDVGFQLNQVKNQINDDKGITLPDEIMEKAFDISIYATDPRYPNELEIDERDVKKALVDSKIIMDWVKNVIEAPHIQTL